MAKIDEGTKDTCTICQQPLYWGRSQHDTSRFTIDLRWRHETPIPQYLEPNWEELNWHNRTRNPAFHDPEATRHCMERKTNGEICNGKAVRDSMCGRHIAQEEKRAALRAEAEERERKARERREADEAIREYEREVREQAIIQLTNLTGLDFVASASYYSNRKKMHVEANGVELARILQAVVDGRFTVEQGRIVPLSDEAQASSSDEGFELTDDDDAWLVG